MPQQLHASTDSASQVGLNAATPYAAARPSTGFSASGWLVWDICHPGHVQRLLTDDSSTHLSTHTHSNIFSYRRQKRLGLDKAPLEDNPPLRTVACGPQSLSFCTEDWTPLRGHCWVSVLATGSSHIHANHLWITQNSSWHHLGSWEPSSGTPPSSCSHRVL